MITHAYAESELLKQENHLRAYKVTRPLGRFFLFDDKDIVINK